MASRFISEIVSRRPWTWDRFFGGLLFLALVAGVPLSFCSLEMGRLSFGQVAKTTANPASKQVTAWLRVASQTPQLAYSLGGETDLDVFYQTQVELIRSPLVVDLALSDKSIAALKLLRDQRDPSAWVVEHLQVARKGQSELLTVSLAGAAGSDAVRIVNSVVAAYIKAANYAHRRQLEEQLAAIKAETPRTIQRLAALNQEYYDSVDVVADPQQSETTSASAASLDPAADGPSDELDDWEPEIGHGVELSVDATREQIAQLYLEMKSWEARRERHLRARLPGNDALPEDEINSRVEQHPEIQDLLFAIEDSQRRMDTIRDVSVRGAKDRKYEEAAQENTASRQALLERREAVRQAVIEQDKHTWQERFEQQLSEFDSEIQRRRIRLRSLVEQLKQQRDTQRSTDPAVLQNRILEDRIAQTQQSLVDLNTRLIRLQTELNAPSRVSILRGAHP